MEIACVALFNDKVLFIYLIYLQSLSTLLFFVPTLKRCLHDSQTFTIVAAHANKFPINGRKHLIFHVWMYVNIAFSIFPIAIFNSRSTFYVQILQKLKICSNTIQ